MVATATFSSKYQISVPKTVRDDLHWKAGQEFVFTPKGKGMLLMPVSDLEQLAGLAKGARIGCRRSASPIRTADAVVYATAREFDAELLTCDTHFENLPGVVFVGKNEAWASIAGHSGLP